MTAIVALSGAITLDSFARVQRETADALSQPDVTLDLSGVTEVDSAAVSLLLHWRRDAHAAKRSLHMRKVPESLGSLASLYGVNTLLPGTVPDA